MRFRLHLSSLSPGFEIAFDGGPGDSKQLDDIFTPISLIDGTKNTFSQIGRIGFHRFAPLYACLLLVFFLSFYHWLRNSANRCRLMGKGIILSMKESRKMLAKMLSH